MGKHRQVKQAMGHLVTNSNAIRTHVLNQHMSHRARDDSNHHEYWSGVCLELVSMKNDVVAAFCNFPSCVSYNYINSIFPQLGLPRGLSLNVLRKRCMLTAPEGSPNRPPMVTPASQAWVPQAHIQCIQFILSRYKNIYAVFKRLHQSRFSIGVVDNSIIFLTQTN